MITGEIKEYQERKLVFHNTDFYVDKRVYVSNPETEILIDYVSNFILEKGIVNKGFVVDVGIGCGSIGMVLSKKFPLIKFAGTDISKDAIDVARINQNALRLKNFELFESNLVLAIKEEPTIVICNLPWGSGNSKFNLDSSSVYRLSLMPIISVYYSNHNHVVGPYIDLTLQILKKGWKTTIFCEIGKIPKKLAMEPFLAMNVVTEYISLTSNYSILKITV